MLTNDSHPEAPYRRQATIRSQIGDVLVPQALALHSPYDISLNCLRASEFSAFVACTFSARWFQHL